MERERATEGSREEEEGDNGRRGALAREREGRQVRRQKRGEEIGERASGVPARMRWLRKA